MSQTDDTRELGLPWSFEDFIRWTFTTGAGFILIVVCWFIAGGKKDFDDQMVFVNLAVAGVVLGLIGNAVWFLKGRRAVGERRARLLGDPDIATDPIASGWVETPVGLFVAGSGLRHYHRPHCILAAGRGWPAGDRAAQEASGREPCGVCVP